MPSRLDRIEDLARRAVAPRKPAAKRMKPKAAPKAAPKATEKRTPRPDRPRATKG